jgi:hypothetical protein
MICPQGMSIKQYQNLTPHLSVDFIDPKWQSNYGMFNRLKIEPFLYRRYSNYDFIFFYELDAWVFRDELQYWCDQGYDYIGAPWFEDYTKASSDSRFIGVGNGGFSLRKVKSHLKALNKFGYVESPSALWRKFNSQPSFRSFRSLVLNLTVRNNIFHRFNTFGGNEDYFWGNVIAPRFKWFTVPPLEIAARFSMEANAPILYERIDQQLPFGCHKWEKYDPDFWKQFIPA